MGRLFALAAAAIVTVVMGQAPSPVWPTTFTINFNETTSRGGRNQTTSGTWYYDFSTGKGRQRIDRANGATNPLCSSANPSATLCQAIVDPGTAARWLVWPSLETCCYCCTTASGCGPVSPDWIVKVNGTYMGRGPYTSPYRSFPSVDTWLAQGNQVNYWRQDATGKTSPIQLQQGTDDYQWFDPSTFSTAPIPDSTFALPSYCNQGNKCAGSCQREDMLN